MLSFSRPDFLLDGGRNFEPADAVECRTSEQTEVCGRLLPPPWPRGAEGMSPGLHNLEQVHPEGGVEQPKVEGEA